MEILIILFQNQDLNELISDVSNFEPSKDFIESLSESEYYYKSNNYVSVLEVQIVFRIVRIIYKVHIHMRMHILYGAQHGDLLVSVRNDIIFLRFFFFFFFLI
jgi:hypothetical protein